MGKYLYIAEKPSVAQEFAKALKVDFSRRDGYLEAPDSIVTWCVGHLVTMNYPEEYDPALKRWTLETIPFLPKEFKYEVIPSVAKQYNTVKYLLNREDVERIYVCTDSGREGEYIYRLVDQMAQVPETKDKRRVWIDSQTEEEILRGIREAKPIAAYDNLSDAAYLRAQEDYLMGINFSRVLTLKYGYAVSNFLKNEKRSAISVGRVMTCVLGMVVRREREIRAFVKTPFYRILASMEAQGHTIEGEFRAVEGSKYFASPLLYKENGFRERIHAEKLIADALGYEPEYQTVTENGKNSYPAVLRTDAEPLLATVTSIEKKKENKNPPLLFNLAELQNECSKLFKISPDETLKVVQELYEKKLVTYPRTDARVLSTAVAKEIHKNIGGMKQLPQFAPFAEWILEQGAHKGLAKTRYVNDKQITDHYAIIPTGQGFGALQSLPMIAKRVYVTIAKRFLSIFYPPAVYQKIALVAKIGEESYFASFRVLMEEGYLAVANAGKKQGEQEKEKSSEAAAETEKSSAGENPNEDEENSFGADFFEIIRNLKKGAELPVSGFAIKEGETAAPKRYNSGSMILAMENAGQLIEDEELRAQIKGSGIGTSATRAEILNKLVKIEYLNLNKKTQIITPTQMGEMIYDVVNASIKSLLNAELTASWEKGLTYVAEGSISKEEYQMKLESFVGRLTNGVKGLNNQGHLQRCFMDIAQNYKSGKPAKQAKEEA
ncbi:MAG: type IA DNA topoisomerase [Lachnospiraceae bacterium]|nr:type IA DNA topoisomerase [Lachnospiraceae bacterium]